MLFQKRHLLEATSSRVKRLRHAIMPHCRLGWKTGFEPATLGITIRCSNRLSYIHHRKTNLNNLGAPGRNRTCNRRLRRPVLYPIELRAPGRNCRTDHCIVDRAPTAWLPSHRQPSQSTRCNTGRDRGIRTLDIQLPKLALYQAELCPDGNCKSSLPNRCRPRRRHQPFEQQRAPEHPLFSYFIKWRARRDSNSRPPSS